MFSRAGNGLVDALRQGLCFFFANLRDQLADNRFNMRMLGKVSGFADSVSAMKITRLSSLLRVRVI